MNTESRRSQFYLLRSNRFVPLFMTQALGAFNDNVFKNALVILIAYSAAFQVEGAETRLMVAAAGGLFILPFFLFSALAGQLADKFSKPELLRKVKLAEIALMAIAAIGFYAESALLLFAVLFLMGTQSAFYSPIKFGLMPDLLREDELIGGNALMSAITFLAILSGTMFGSLIILRNGGVDLAAVSCLLVAVAGWWASRYVLARAAADPNLKISFNLLAETWRVISYASKDVPMMRSIVGISWFWLVGSVFIILFPVFARDVLSGNEQVVATLLFVFSVGIALGSLTCNKLLKGKVRDYYVPFGALGITIFSVDLFFASEPVLVEASGVYVGLRGLLAQTESWRVLADLTGIAFCGGLYIVPLNAILQSRAEPERRARMIAANNVLNALGMVGASVFVFWLTLEGMTIPYFFLAIGLLNIPVTIYVSYIVISDLMRRISIRLGKLT